MTPNYHGYKELLRLVKSLEDPPKMESFLTLGIRDMTKVLIKSISQKGFSKMPFRMSTKQLARPNVEDSFEARNQSLRELDPENLIESKTTTQHAPLEKFLTFLRTRKILNYTVGKSILDFGCGADLRTLRAIGSRAKCRYGIDSVFKEHAIKQTEGITAIGSFSELRHQLDKNKHSIDCILSLACFEHLHTHQLRKVLIELHKISGNDTLLIGTVPTPAAKPVLEFLSFRLRLIDPSQIIDHHVYYNKKMLTNALRETGWIIVKYRKFQIGMNSFFIFKKITH